MFIGAIDPLEGALLIMSGSGAVVLGAAIGRCERRVIAYRLAVFVLIAIGVGAMWGLSSLGGFGGKSGRSEWWGVLILPYLVGWSLGMWGTGAPRWLSVPGILVGLWYVVLMGICVSHPGRGVGNGPGIVIGVIGLLTIGGCVNRMRKS
jgi:hypothetical protein